jgi:hypothetical protein
MRYARAPDRRSRLNRRARCEGGYREAESFERRRAERAAPVRKN